VLVQAERYSKAIDQTPKYQGEFGAPFLYATNGEVFWFHDVRHVLNRSRQVAGFHTPVALNEMLTRDFDAELGRLSTIPMNERIRPYQCEANEAIEQALRDRKRKMLVTMATGTGKTLMPVHEVYRLMKSGVARRVLFIVDRRALAAQTVRAFASFEAEPGLKVRQALRGLQPALPARRLRRRKGRKGASIRKFSRPATSRIRNSDRHSSTSRRPVVARDDLEAAGPLRVGTGDQVLDHTELAERAADLFQLDAADAVRVPRRLAKTSRGMS
jgi:hypothetical protein